MVWDLIKNYLVYMYVSHTLSVRAHGPTNNFCLLCTFVQHLNFFFLVDNRIIPETQVCE